MSAWEIDWHFPAKAALLNMPWRDAARVDAAVMRYAESGRGDTSRIADERGGLWLRVPGYVARLRLLPRERTISVLYVFRKSG